MLYKIARWITLRTGTMGMLFSFLWKNKLWWLIPLVLMLLVFGILIVLGQSTPLGPFIYTIF